ncbi:MAG: NAD(P)-binding domain-containing protein [Ginsengibacter sp.]
MKKTIAIVGATETTGRIIVKKFASMPYRLLLISNEINELDNLTKDLSVTQSETEIESLDCVKDGCWEADIIILAVPIEKLKEVAESIKEVATQKIVVEIFAEKKNSEELRKILPYSKLATISGDFQSEIIVSGEDEIVNEEIRKIFNLANFQVAI